MPKFASRKQHSRMGSVREELPPSIPLDDEADYSHDDSPYTLERPLQTIRRFSQAFDATFVPPSFPTSITAGNMSPRSTPTSRTGTPTSSSVALPLIRPSSVIYVPGLFDPLSFPETSPYDAAFTYSSNPNFQDRRRNSMFFMSGGSTPETRSLYETSSHSPINRSSVPPPLPLGLGASTRRDSDPDVTYRNNAENPDLSNKHCTPVFPSPPSTRRRGASELGKSPLQDSVIADHHIVKQDPSKSKRTPRFLSTMRRTKSEFEPTDTPTSASESFVTHKYNHNARMETISKPQPVQTDGLRSDEKESWIKRTKSFMVFFRRGSFKRKLQVANSNTVPPSEPIQNSVDTPIRSIDTVINKPSKLTISDTKPQADIQVSSMKDHKYTVIRNQSLEHVPQFIQDQAQEQKEPLTPSPPLSVVTAPSSPIPPPPEVPPKLDLMSNSPSSENSALPNTVETSQTSQESKDSPILSNDTRIIYPSRQSTGSVEPEMTNGTPSTPALSQSSSLETTTTSTNCTPVLLDGLKEGIYDFEEGLSEFRIAVVSKEEARGLVKISSLSPPSAAKKELQV